MSSRGRPSGRRGTTIAVTPRAGRGRGRGGRGRGRGRGAASTPDTPRAESAKKRVGRPRGSGRGGRGGSTSARRGQNPWEDDDELDRRPDYYSHSEESDEDEDEEVLSPKREHDDDDFDAPSSPCAPLSPADLDVPEGALCPWLELPPEEVPPLILPDSSLDLILPSSIILRVLEIYELCRSYYRSIQVSPFLFEDFCAALTSVDQSCLLAELHISLFKMCLKDDEEEQFTYSVQDSNNSWNVVLQLLEPMTYAEVIRQYVESDTARFPPEVLDAISQRNYPFVSMEYKLTVLSWLCERFLGSQEYKKIIKNDGKIQYDIVCRVCAKPGEVLLCEECEACYHLECTQLEQVPEGSWICDVCQQHQLKGVSDSLPAGQKPDRQPLRMQPIGTDRHGRVYWFVVRRIFVLDVASDSLAYFSTAPQLHQLSSRLDPTRLEWALCRRINELLPDIVEQMAITVELTGERRMVVEETCRDKSKPPPNEAYLHTDNVVRMCAILHECRDKYGELDGEEEDEANIDDESLPLSYRIERMMGVYRGRLSNTFWTNGVDEDTVLAYSDAELPNPTVLWRLGAEGGFREYRNIYSLSELAKAPDVRQKEKERRKYMCSRFSLEGDGQFDWSVAKGRDIYASEGLICKYLEWTMKKMLDKIPPELMHRAWGSHAAGFIKDLGAANTMEKLRLCLLKLECAMRKPLFLPQWWNSLGHTRLNRTSPEDRETRSKAETNRKKAERELTIADQEDDTVVWVRYTRLPGGAPKHNIWRLKDEQYRMNGREALGGWMWMSWTMERQWVELPEKPPIGVLHRQETECDSVAVKKARRIDRLATKLLEWRQGPTKSNEEETSSAVDDLMRDLDEEGGEGEKKEIKQEIVDRPVENTRDVAKAIAPGVKVKKEAGVLGEDLTWPMPRVNYYEARRSKKRSLLVLQTAYLRRMARQGGLNAAFYYPGFNRTAKANFYVWNYPCPRPIFDNCWKWLTLHARSLHALALQMRILYASVRWSDMKPDDPEETALTIRSVEHDETRFVIGHKECPPDGFYERYRLTIHQFPLDDDDDDGDDDSDNYRAGRNGDTIARSRKRKSVLMKKAPRRKGKGKAFERWIDGVELKLWEIIGYWQKWNHDRVAATRFVQLPQAAAKVKPPAAIKMEPVGGPQSPATPKLPPRGMVASPKVLAPRSMGQRAPMLVSGGNRYDGQGPVATYQSVRASTGQPQVYQARFPVAQQRVAGQGGVRVVSRPQAMGAMNPMSPVSVRVLGSPQQARLPVQRMPYTRGGQTSQSYLANQHGRLPVKVQQMQVKEEYVPAEEFGEDGQPLEGEYAEEEYAVAEPEVKRVKLEAPAEEGRVSGGQEYLQGGRVRTVGPRQFAASVGSDGSMRRVMMVQQPGISAVSAVNNGNADTASSSMVSDDPPVIPRYDNAAGSYNQPRVIQRSSQQMYAQPGPSQNRVAPGMGKLLMIRRPDGTTQMLRPVQKDGEGVVVPVMSSGSLRGGMMNNGGNRYSSGGGMQSIDDHAGLVQPRRMLSAVRGGRPNIIRGIAPSAHTRFVRVGNNQSFSAGIPSTMRSLRTPLVADANSDPFMKRMAAEKAVSGAPALNPQYAGGQFSNVRRRVGGYGGDTYAGYYGEKSNASINVDQYQALAEQGFRPPGRPPGRLASTFGYGPKAAMRGGVVTRGGMMGSGGARVMQPVGEVDGEPVYEEWEEEGMEGMEGGEYAAMGDEFGEGELEEVVEGDAAVAGLEQGEEFYDDDGAEWADAQHYLEGQGEY